MANAARPRDVASASPAPRLRLGEPAPYQSAIVGYECRAPLAAAAAASLSRVSHFIDVRPMHEHRNLGRAHQLVGDSVHQESLQGAAPARFHRDEIGAAVVRRRQNRACRVPVPTRALVDAVAESSEILRDTFEVAQGGGDTRHRECRRGRRRLLSRSVVDVKTECTALRCRRRSRKREQSARSRRRCGHQRPDVANQHRRVYSGAESVARERAGGAGTPTITNLHAVFQTPSQISCNAGGKVDLRR